MGPVKATYKLAEVPKGTGLRVRVSYGLKTQGPKRKTVCSSAVCSSEGVSVLHFKLFDRKRQHSVV